MSMLPDAPQELQVADLSKRELAAIKQVAGGKASESDQVLAMSVIIKKLSRAYDLTYVPGSPTASSFLAGRGFVGQQITKIINQPIARKRNET